MLSASSNASARRSAGAWRRVSVYVAGALVAGAGSGPQVSAATTDAAATTNTEVVIRLATDTEVPIQSQWIDQPPTVVIQFPQGEVNATLPERSAIQRGVIREIRAVYGIRPDVSPFRWLDRLEIQLQDRYPYTLKAERGRIRLDIEHPAVLATGNMQVGLAGGVILSGLSPQPLSERFQAMETALRQAHPQSASAAGLTAAIAHDTANARLPGSAMRASAQPRRASPSPWKPRTIAWPGTWTTLLLLGLLGCWWGVRRSGRGFFGGRAYPFKTSQPSSGLRLIDQLVWQAFERKGYQLLHTVEPAPLAGLMRVMVKDGQKAGLLCIGEGVFFEKSIVEQFAAALKHMQLPQGFLAAPGAFTVPAQRCAKEHAITLIGRDQLTELVSEGAMSEFYTTQLQQLHQQLDEARETLNQYAQQLDLIRRQRNEASWYLGEERAQSAQLQEQIASVEQQMRHWQAEAERWQRTAEDARKQWEESQWYLGESRITAHQLEAQVRTLQEVSSRLEERCRELSDKVEEVQRGHAALQQQTQELLGKLAAARQQLESAQQQGQEHERLLTHEQSRRRLFELEVNALRAYGERRKALRVYPSDGSIELADASGATLFQGSLRDLSRTGFGIDSTEPLTLPDRLKVRLQLPGLERVLESKGRMVWQRHDVATQRYRSGCQLSNLSVEARELFELALTHLQSQGGA